MGNKWWPWISKKKHNEILNEFENTFEEYKDSIEYELRQIKEARDKIAKGLEELQKSKCEDDLKLKKVFMYLAEVGAMINTERGGFQNGTYYYHVIFIPKLRDPENLQREWGHEYNREREKAERELAILHQMIMRIGVPDWEYDPSGKWLKKTYSSEICNVIEQVRGDIERALSYLNSHLSEMVKEKTYTDILEKALELAPEPPGSKK